MCLSIPSKVVKIDTERNVATVDTMGVQREAGLELMEEGDVKIIDANGKEIHYNISGGVVECKKNNVILLIEKVLA